jgi:hypothetical protein
MKQPWPVLRHYSGVRLRRLGETENLICEGVRLFQSRDMNPGPLERTDTYLITFMYAIPKCDDARRILL